MSKPQSRAKFWRRRSLVVVIAAMAAIPMANYASRRIAAAYLSSMLGGNASIARVRLGLRSVIVDGITVHTRQNVAPLLSVDRVAIDVTLWSGIRRGVWLDEIVVERPQIQLHFSDDGELLTHLPGLPQGKSDEGPPRRLPLRKFQVKNGRFAIHQPGRRAFDIDDVSLLAVARSRQLRVTVVIPKLFDAACQLKSAIDLETWAAESLLSVDGVQVSSAETVRLPLMPASVNALSWQGSTSFEIRQSGLLSDPGKCRAVVHLHELGLGIQDRPLIQLAGVLTAKDAAIESRLQGTALGGKVALQGRLAFPEDGPCGKAILRCAKLDTDSLPTGLAPEGVRGLASTDMNLSATLADGMLLLSGRNTAIVADANVHGIAFAPVHVELNVDGGVDLRAGSHRSHGMITADVASEGVSLRGLSAAVNRRPRMDAPVPDPPNEQAPRTPRSQPPSGRVRGAAYLTIPLATMLEPGTFHLEGELEAADVEVNGVAFTDGVAVVLIDSGTASITCTDVRLHDASANRDFALAASLRAGLLPSSEITANFEITDLPCATLARVAGQSLGDLDGVLAARAVANCPTQDAGDVASWRGGAYLQFDAVRVNGCLIADGEANCQVQAGSLVLEKLRGTFAGGDVSGSGMLALTRPFMFRGELTLHDADVECGANIVRRSTPALASGRIDMTAVADGEIATPHWQAQGTMHGSALQIGSRGLGDVRVDFVASPRNIVVATPPQGFLGGNLNVSAALAGLSGVPATASVTGSIIDVPVPVIAKLAGFSEATEGLVSCHFDATSRGEFSSLQANFIARSDAVSVRKASVQNLSGRFKLAQGAGQLDLHADALGGRLDLVADARVADLASLTPAQWQELTQLPVDAKIDVSNVRIHQLWPLLGTQRALRPLKGVVNATIERGDAERRQAHIANAQVTFRDLRWDNVSWSHQLRAELVLGRNSLELRELVGPFASGRLTGRGKVALDASHSGAFQLSLSRAALSKLVAPLDRSGDLVDGSMSLRMQGRLGPRPTGRGFVAMDRGEIGPLAFAQLRVPIDWSFDPASSAVRWRATNAGVELGGGRVITNAKGQWNGKLNMSLTTTARRVDTGRILKNGSLTGGGYLDGTMRLTARGASRPEDFLGTFQATLSDSQSLQLPVLSEMTKFLGSLPTATSFEESTLRGRLGNGVVTLDRATMTAANAQILVEGTATLQGRLNLRVMAQTNESGPADKLLELADSPLMLAGPAPIAIIAKANDALKDRVVHLRIGGTTVRPAIRLDPTRQLGREAIKFFLNQTFAYRNKSDVKF